jgi:hypothetical protein
LARGSRKWNWKWICCRLVEINGRIERNLMEQVERFRYFEGEWLLGVGEAVEATVEASGLKPVGFLEALNLLCCFIDGFS